MHFSDVSTLKMNGFAFCETDNSKTTTIKRRHQTGKACHRGVRRLHDFLRRLSCISKDEEQEKKNNQNAVSENTTEKLDTKCSSTVEAASFWILRVFRNPTFVRIRIQQNHLQAVLLSFVCCFCYFNALFCDFAFDDSLAVKENADLRPETPLTSLLSNDFWGQPMSKELSHKSYRPVSVFTFRLNYAVHGLRPFGYHLINVLLHVVVTLLYARFCRLIVASQCAFLAALLFSVHPIHTEAVTSVVGRAETLSATFYLLALLVYSKATKRCLTNWHLLLASIILSFLATFSKEQGATAFALCALYEVLYNQKLHQIDVAALLQRGKHQQQSISKSPRRIKEMVPRIGALALATVVAILLRLRVMHSQLPVFTSFDNPAAYSPTPIRRMTHHYLVALNGWLLLNPLRLCCDWTMGSVPLVTSLADPRNSGTAFCYLLLLLAIFSALRNRLTADGPTIVCSVALLVVPFLPASNLFFYVGFVIAERVLYLPSCGFCLLVAFGMLKLLRLFERKFWLTIFLKLSLTLLVGSHIAKTVLRNEDWKTEMRLFTSGLKVHPGNAKLLNNIGHVLEGEDQFEEALKYFLRATQVQPDDLGAFINVGRAYSSLGMTSKAEVYFRKAKDLLPTSVVSKDAKSGPTYARIAPSHLNLFLNLGSLLAQNRSRLSEAEALYRQAIRMRPDFVDAYMRRAEVLLKLNRSDEAEAVYRTALRFDDGNADIHYNLGVVAIENRQLHQAIEHFETAIRLHPKHPQALLNYAIVVQDAGRQELLFLAETRLKMLLSTAQDPANLERIYFHLGMIAMNTDHLSDAEHWFSSALALRADHRSAAFNLALLFTNSGRPLKALPWLQTLLRHHPDHLKGLTLLCDLLINHSKNMSQAEACYQRLLRARPADIAARHNLCVVYVEQGRLDEAESCLLKAATLGASHQDYVDRHLAIVRLRIAKMRSAAANAKKNSSAP